MQHTSKIIQFWIWVCSMSAKVNLDWLVAWHKAAQLWHFIKCLPFGAGLMCASFIAYCTTVNIESETANSATNMLYRQLNWNSNNVFMNEIKQETGLSRVPVLHDNSCKYAWRTSTLQHLWSQEVFLRPWMLKECSCKSQLCYLFSKHLLSCVIIESVRESTSNSQPFDITDMRDRMLDSVRTIVRTRSEASEDYDPVRYPATAKFLDHPIE